MTPTITESGDYTSDEALIYGTDSPMCKGCSIVGDLVNGLCPDCEGPFCDDCDERIDTKRDKFYQLSDPWGRLTGDCVCENCRERHWDRYQEKLMEET